MYYYTIVFILSFYSFFCVFGQNINDPDYYPPQINPNTDPIRRYLRLWSGILRNVAGDSESNYNYNYQQNNVRDFQQNSYQQPSYNEYNQRPFENLLKSWKNRIEEINLTPKSFNDGIPLNQLRSNTNHESNDDQQNYLPSMPNIKSSNDKEIISEMLLHKLLPRNKGDMYAFTSTTLKPPTTTTDNEIPPSTVKSKSHKKTSKKNSSKSTSDSPLSLDDSNIGKNYKAKVKIGPSEELEKTTITPVTDTTTTETDVEGSGEELTNIEKETITNNIIDSEEEEEEEEEEDGEEVEEVVGNEENQKKVGDLDTTTNLPKVTEKLLNNSTVSKKNNTTEVDEKIIDEKDKDDKENTEDEEYSEEQNEVPEAKSENIKSVKNDTLEHDNEEEYNEVEYSSEEEVSTTTQPTTTTTLLTTTTTKKNKNPSNLKNNKQVKKEKTSGFTKNNKKNHINGKKKAKEEANEPYTIPEAEEEEDFLLPKHSYAAQIDSIPESETTSTTKATPSQAQSVYNFYTNANANSTPNNSNTVVPVNTMVDGILPLLIPLLASRTPYLQNMLDNLAYGAKTANDITPVKNESLIPMFSDKNNNHKVEKHLLSPIDKKVSDAIDSIKSIDKRIALDYLKSVVPQQISNTNNGKIKNYYKTKIPEKTSNYIPLRPTNL
uniref:DUF148 domain-containing protein n=1 Tax=Strongyloides papillosus TaxID=174720 RepID=A0A0N5CDH4_STREA